MKAILQIMFATLLFLPLAAMAGEHKHHPGCGHEVRPTPEPTPPPVDNPEPTPVAATSGGSDDFANAVKGVAIGVILTCGVRSVWVFIKHGRWTWCGDLPQIGRASCRERV